MIWTRFWHNNMQEARQGCRQHHGQWRARHNNFAMRRAEDTNTNNTQHSPQLRIVKLLSVNRVLLSPRFSKFIQEQTSIYHEFRHRTALIVGHIAKFDLLISQLCDIYKKTICHTEDMSPSAAAVRSLSTLSKASLQCVRTPFARSAAQIQPAIASIHTSTRSIASSSRPTVCRTPPQSRILSCRAFSATAASSHGDWSPPPAGEEYVLMQCQI